MYKSMCTVQSQFCSPVIHRCVQQLVPTPHFCKVDQDCGNAGVCETVTSTLAWNRMVIVIFHKKRLKSDTVQPTQHWW